MGKLIIDGIEVGGSSSASSVKYNNTNSTLVSTNVQGAITELNESLSELNKNLQSNTTNITNVTNKVNNLSIPFMNTSNVLYTQSQANFSYTATEDCVIAGSIEAGGSSAVVAYVNNVRVGAGYSGAGKDITVSLFIPLKKGQTFKLESNKFNSSYPLKAFALL